MGRATDTPFLGTLVVLAAVVFVQACTSREVVLVIVGNVSVSPPAASLLEGETLQFSAVVVDDRGASLRGAEVEWSSEDPQVITISGSGVAVAVQQGRATIRAEFHGVSG